MNKNSLMKDFVVLRNAISKMLNDISSQRGEYYPIFDVFALTMEAKDAINANDHHKYLLVSKLFKMNEPYSTLILRYNNDSYFEIISKYYTFLIKEILMTVYKLGMHIINYNEESFNVDFKIRQIWMDEYIDLLNKIHTGQLEIYMEYTCSLLFCGKLLEQDEVKRVLQRPANILATTIKLDQVNVEKIIMNDENEYTINDKRSEMRRNIMRDNLWNREFEQVERIVKDGSDIKHQLKIINNM